MEEGGSLLSFKHVVGKGMEEKEEKNWEWFK